MSPEYQVGVLVLAAVGADLPQTVAASWLARIVHD